MYLQNYKLQNNKITIRQRAKYNRFVLTQPQANQYHKNSVYQETIEQRTDVKMLQTQMDACFSLCGVLSQEHPYSLQ